MKREDGAKLAPKAKLAGRFRKGAAPAPSATAGAGGVAPPAGAGKQAPPVLPAGASKKLKGFPFGKK